jgi:hypothetical protein
MDFMRKSVAAAAVAASVVIGGATGAVLFGPSLAGAQTSTTTPGAAATCPGGPFKSNEDPAHEAKETPEQEAAEDSGTFCGHRGPHGPNGDPTHTGPKTPGQNAAGTAGGGPGTGYPGPHFGHRGPGAPGGPAPATGAAPATGSATQARHQF